MSGTALATIPKNAVVGKHGIEIDTLEKLEAMADYVLKSGLAPKECNSVANIIVRAQMGMELGLSFMYSIQNIANINGRPAIWGDAIPALVLSSGLCAEFAGRFVGKDDGSYTDDFRYEVTARRKGHETASVVSFSVGDAKKAGLWGKNVWAPYPKDMMRHKAVARAAKIVFPDVLGGIACAEDIRDYIEVEAQPIAPPRNVEDITARLEAENQTAAPEPEQQGPTREELTARWRTLKKKHTALTNKDLKTALARRGCAVMEGAPLDVLSAAMDDVESVMNGEQGDLLGGSNARHHED